jgi:aspartyl-tRNA(Asn)/glutamyl-tRNA(Gln) amidotransferase subunit B
MAMRSKEEAHDYRYFPEPDLPPLVVDAARVRDIQASMPELPEARRHRFAAALGLPAYDAAQLTQSRAHADFFEATVDAGAPPKAASNWIRGELARALKDAELEIGRSPVTPTRLAGLLALVDDGTISGAMAKGVFEKMFTGGQSAADIVGAVQGREGGDLRIPRRAGDAGGGGESEPQARERAAAAGARPVIMSTGLRTHVLY